MIRPICNKCHWRSSKKFACRAAQGSKRNKNRLNRFKATAYRLWPVVVASLSSDVSSTKDGQSLFLGFNGFTEVVDASGLSIPKVGPLRAARKEQDVSPQ